MGYIKLPSYKLSEKIAPINAVSWKLSFFENILKNEVWRAMLFLLMHHSF